MRGPNSNSKDEIAEEIVNVSTKCDTKYGNELQANYPASCSRTVSIANAKKETENGTPIWKVGRILIDSLSKGKMRRTKIFGAALEDLPLNCQGIPKIVQRLCYHLEHYGLNETELFVCDKKYNKLLEKLRISFDRAGDADLESCENVRAVAALLKLWLHDLPYPLISQKVAARLKIIFQKYNRKEVYDLNGEICNVLVKCSTLNLGVLFTVVRLLHRYVTKWYPSSHVDQVPEMFAKLLLENIEAESGVEIVTTLVHNFREIFNERILEIAFKSCIIGRKKSRDSSKIDLPIALACGNSPLSVDKLPRSNSEEKLDVPNCRDVKSSPKNVVVKIRRVSSEENFRGSQQHYRCPANGRIIDVSIGRENDSKLANVFSNRDGNLNCEKNIDDEPVVDECQKMMCPSDVDSQVLVAPPPLILNEDFRLREEIRNEERFAPQFNAYRNTGRKKRATYYGHNVVPAMRTVSEDDFTYAVPKLDELFDDDAYEHYLETSTCLERNSRTENYQPKSTSFGYSSGCPFIKIPPSSESVQRSVDRFEPSTHHRSWIYPHQHPYLKLQNSNYQLKEGNSSHSMHLSHIDSKILQLNKRLQWIKKRMKHFEKDYEGKYGDSPTMMNKMLHPEYKQMSMTIICLKQNLKQLRKDANESFSTHRLLANNNQNDVNVLSSITNKQKAYDEAEKQMREKRLDSERPECVDDMTYEQLQDEKVSIQKELFNLENTFGQIEARNEKIFEPIYSRFRNVKRLLARSCASLKLKGTITDLATIKENETMEFDSSSQTTISNETKPNVSPCQSVCDVSINDFRVDNINELSSPELMLAYKTTKEERKKLRNRISIYEQEAENNTTNDSKHCIHSLRCRYKNTKAKLKLLEALLMKTK